MQSKQTHARTTRRNHRAFLITFLLLGLLLPSTRVEARESYRDALATELGLSAGSLSCLTCHVSAAGGWGCSSPPCLNPFGDDVREALPGTSGASVWWPLVAPLDSDGDGYSNALELGDTDGDGLSDAGRSSPGTPSEVNECELNWDSCGGNTPYCQPLSTSCGPQGATGYTCLAQPAEPPPPPFLAQPWRHPLHVSDREWVFVDTTLALNPGVPSSCSSSRPSAWLYFEGSCAGSLRLEVRDQPGAQNVVGRYVVPTQQGGCETPPTETTCARANEGLGRVDASDTDRWVRVMSPIRGEVRLVCAPSSEPRCTAPSPAEPDPEDPDEFPDEFPDEYGEPPASFACPESAPGCEYAATVSDGSYIVDTSAGGACSGPGGTWLRYTATCTGKVVVKSRLVESAESDRSACVTLYSGDCAADESLTCGCGTLDYWGVRESDAEVETRVIEGEAVVIQVAGSRHQEQVSVQCVPRIHDSYCELCDERAACHVDVNGGTLECQCPAGYTGDGLRVERGNAGCVSVGEGWDECAEAGFTCDENAYCVAVPGAPVCECRPGYEGSGITCRDREECFEPLGVGTCKPHNHARCINEPGGFYCGCEPGYSSVGSSDEEVICAVRCGDGFRGPGEECDDGNLIEGDGCSVLCQEERNFRCFEPVLQSISECENTCGDGLIDANEDYFCDRDLSDCGSLPMRGRGSALGFFVLCLPAFVSLFASRWRRTRRDRQ